MRGSCVCVSWLTQTLSLGSTQRAALHEQIAAAGPQVARVAAFVKALQRDVEQDLSGRYSNRPVHLIGDINTI